LQGVSDLSGNVWEWCLNAYDEPANTQVSGAFRRVVRGGSWIFSQGDARAANRLNGDPGVRTSLIGFRVCCVSPHLNAIQ
jgi:formylglycine-generating enzyme required for sulfatase activity